MSKIHYSVKIDKDLDQMVNMYIKKKGKGYTKTKVIEDALRFYLENETVAQMDSFYSPMLSKIMHQHTLKMENRLSSLLAKATIDGAMSMFMDLEMLSKLNNEKSGDVYDRIRVLAARHVKNRYEVLDNEKEG